MVGAVKVCHVTSVHGRYDSRIFLKECRSLAASHEVTLLVADGKGPETRDGVRILDAGCRPRNEIRRVRFSMSRMAHDADAIDADVFHLHDPELLPVASAFARRGRKVIYDSHEDLPRQLRTKTWAPRWLFGLMSPVVDIYEQRVARRLSAVVAATDHIRDRFERAGVRSVAIRNYPLDEEFFAPRGGTSRSGACYVGGIFETRGAHQMAAAAALSGVPLSLAGPFSPGSLEQDLLRRAPRPDLVRIMGVLERRAVARLLSESAMGLVVLADVPSYRESLPVKMFEYMAAGLPVIASNFPLWRSIVEHGECGLCVDPSSPGEIARAMTAITSDPHRAARMGENGRRLVSTRYNWRFEAQRLIDLYRTL